MAGQPKKEVWAFCGLEICAISRRAPCTQGNGLHQIGFEEGTTLLLKSVLVQQPSQCIGIHGKGQPRKAKVMKIFFFMMMLWYLCNLCSIVS